MAIGYKGMMMGLLAAGCSAVAADSLVVKTDFGPVLIDVREYRRNPQPSPQVVYTHKATDNGGEFDRIGDGKNLGLYGRYVVSDKPIPVVEGGTYEVSFEWRVSDLGTKCVSYLLPYVDATNRAPSGVTAPAGWTFSECSAAFYFTPAVQQRVGEWVKVTKQVTVPIGVASVKPTVCVWRGKDLDCRNLKLVNLDTSSCSRVGLDDQLAIGVSSTRDAAGFVRVKAEVKDLSVPPRPRALLVTATLARDLTDWTYHQDWRTDLPVKAKSDYRYETGVGGHGVSQYPFSSVSRDGVGFAIGTDLGEPAFESRVVTSRGIISSQPLGLLARRGHGTEGALYWTIFPFRGAWGFRSAAKAFYAHEGHKLPQWSSDDKVGAWIWPCAPTVLPENPDDFGLTFWEATQSLARRKAERDRMRELNIKLYPYTEAWGMRQTDSQVDGKHLPLAERLAELQSWASETNSRASWFGCPRCESARACLNSLPIQPDGTHPFSRDFYGDWMLWWRTNPDPRIELRPSRASICFGKEVDPLLEEADGFYLDSVMSEVADYNNIRPEHLEVVDENLVYDAATGKPCSSGMQHLYAFVAHLERKLRPRGKRIFGNVYGGAAFRFTATQIDLYGTEVGRSRAEKQTGRQKTYMSDPRACMMRFYAYHRPINILLQAGDHIHTVPILPECGMEWFVEDQMFYGFFPSVSAIGGEEKPGYAGWRRYFDKARQCERDRALFKAAIPVVRALYRAGWEPETLVRTSAKDMRIERYGAPERGDCHLTIRNFSDKPAVGELRFENGFAPSAFEPLWKTFAPQKIPQGWAITLPPWGLAVVRVR